MVTCSEKKEKKREMVELTVPFELYFEAATRRKRAKYSELLDSCKKAGYGVNLITIGVGARGFINASNFDALYAAILAKRAEQGSREGGGTGVPTALIQNMVQT